MTWLIWLLAISPQDPDLEAKLDDLARHAAEVDRIARELAELGAEAIEPLRARAAAARGELRARLEGVAAELERRERLREFTAEPARVTVQAAGRPLSEIVDKIAAEGRVRIRFGSAARSDAADLDVAGASPLEALDRLCRGHGKLVLRLPKSSDDPLVLDRGEPGRIPRWIGSQSAVELSSVALSHDSDFGSSFRGETRLQFQLFWEPGLRPMAANLVVKRLRDESGEEYVTSPIATPAGGSWRRPARQVVVTVPKTPTLEVSVLSLIEGTLELVFPSDLVVVRVEAPDRRLGMRATGDSTWFTPVDFTRGPRRTTCRVVAPPGFDMKAREFRLVGAPGTFWSGTVDRTEATADETVLHLSFAASPDAEVRELQLVRAVTGPSRRIEWRLENVPVR